jgi:ADP-heptose:LPS heptosyltransferase
MKLLIAVNNSSVGAVKNAVAEARLLYKEARITLLVKENTEEGFKSFFADCDIMSYVEGATAASAGSVNTFLEKIKSAAYDMFIVLREKDTARDLRLELIGFFCGFKKYCIFDAVTNKIIRQYGLPVYLRMYFYAFLPPFAAALLFFCFMIFFILGLPGYLLKGEAKTAGVFFRNNVYNLAGYLLSGLRQVLRRCELEIFIYLEFVRNAYGRKKVFEKEKIKKILVIKIEHLGDFILAQPLLRALRHNFPKAKISLLVSPWNFAIAAGCPYIDELLLYKTNNPVFNRGRKHHFLLFWRIIFFIKLRCSGYDLCLDTGGWIETFMTSYASGAGFKGALDYKRVNNIFNIRLAEFQEKDNEITRSFKLLELFAIREKLEAATGYWLSGEELEKARKTLAAGGVKPETALVGFYAGASSAPLRWGRRNFAGVINALPLTDGIKVIIFNAPGEQAYMKGLTGMLKVPYLMMPEKQSLKEFAALVAHCRLFVSNDGGLSHLATAMKVPTVTLYGPSNAKEWGPYSASRLVITKNYPCSPCRKTNCIRNICMEAIKIEEVLEAVKCGLGLTRQA